MCGLAAVGLSALYFLGVLYGYPSLTALKENDENNYNKQHRKDDSEDVSSPPVKKQKTSHKKVTFKMEEETSTSPSLGSAKPEDKDEDAVSIQDSDELDAMSD